MNKVKRIAYPVPASQRDHRLFGLRHTPSQNSERAREIISLFRSPHTTFSDTGSPLLQMDLIRNRGIQSRRETSDLTTADMTNIIDGKR